MNSIGIVGLGYVGTAIKNGFENLYDVCTFDLKGDCTHNSIESLCADANLIFVCVPTPMNAEGFCSTQIVESVVSQISKSKKNNIVIIKERLNRRYHIELSF